MQKGQVPASKLETIGYGESRPVADNGNYQGRILNRRVVFRIFYADQNNIENSKKD